MYADLVFYRTNIIWSKWICRLLLWVVYEVLDHLLLVWHSKLIVKWEGRRKKWVEWVVQSDGALYSPIQLLADSIMPSIAEAMTAQVKACRELKQTNLSLLTSISKVRLLPPPHRPLLHVACCCKQIKTQFLVLNVVWCHSANKISPQRSFTQTAPHPP